MIRSQRQEASAIQTGEDSEYQETVGSGRCDRSSLRTPVSARTEVPSIIVLFGEAL